MRTLTPFEVFKWLVDRYSTSKDVDEKAAVAMLIVDWVNRYWSGKDAPKTEE